MERGALQEAYPIGGLDWVRSAVRLFHVSIVVQPFRCQSARVAEGAMQEMGERTSGMNSKLGLSLSP